MVVLFLIPALILAFVFTTPRNDLRLQFQAVERLIERLTQLKELPKDSTAYQGGLDDARGIIRELPRLRDGLMWCSLGGWRRC